jgi:HK97 family phage major capsid protein
MYQAPVHEALIAKRDRKQAELEAITAKPLAERRSLRASEVRQFEAVARKIGKLDAKLADQEKERVRLEKAERARAGMGDVYVRGEPGPYRPDEKDEFGRQVSLLRDAAMVVTGRAGPGEQIRYQRFLQYQSAHESALAESESRAYERAMTRVDDLAAEKADREKRGLEQRTNPNTTAGTGGEFVPPLWLVSDYVPLARPKRVTADRCVNMPLPPGIDVINIPKITTGSSVLPQAAQGSGVASVDIVTTSVSAPVITLAGQQDISMQLIEQSPVAMDGVVFQDLQADLAKRLDINVISGSGSGGQLTGLTNTASITTTSNGTATLQALYTAMTQSISAIYDTRYDSPDAMVWHPRRLMWALGLNDTNRPLIVPTEQGVYNASGVLDQLADMERPVARALTLPIYIDPNIPTTVSTNQDPVLICRFSDFYLWESTPRWRSLPEILSGTLQLRFQVYEYVAFAVRFAPSVTQITGAGMAAPSNYT